MSSSSSSPTGRRRLLAALPVLALPALWAHAQADPPATAGLQRWGSGAFRRFGFLVYEATLWAGPQNPTVPPLALQLTYRRAIRGAAIAEASVAELSRLNVAPSVLDLWEQRMQALFPDVAPGDTLLGAHRGETASFFHNGRAIGEIAEPGFAGHFFGIWLDPRTSAPELRAALLRRPAS